MTPLWRRGIVALCCFVATCLAIPASALAEELTAVADAYVRVGYSTNYNDGTLHAKCSGGGSGTTTRKAFIRFQRTSSAQVTSAIMRLWVSTFNDSGGATSADFYLWGVQNNHAAEDFSESGVTHNTYTDLLDTSIDGTTNNPAALFDGDPFAPGVQPLAMFTVIEANLGQMIAFSSPAIAEFINQSTDSTITFVITRATDDGSLNTGFASSENSTYSGPQLDINPPDPVELKKVTGVTHNFTSMGLSSNALNNGTLIGQAVTIVGGDPGTLRMNTSGQVKYQESDGGAHTSGETVDVVAFMQDMSPNGIPMELGSFTMSATTSSQSTTVSADADAHVWNGYETNYGAYQELYVKKNGGSGTLTRKAFIRFTIPAASSVSAATLRMYVSTYSTTLGSTFHVWGIKDATQAEAFDEMSVMYSTYPFLDNSADGTNNDPDYLYDGDSSQADAQSLGTFSVTQADLNTEVSFTSTALRDFLASDTDGTATILVTRETSDNNLNTNFASRENTSLPGPELDITYVPDNVYTLSFTKTYQNPVVLVQPVTENGGDAISVYPVFTGPTFAAIEMAEGPAYDGSHTSETIHYAVFEAGFYHLTESIFLDVGLNSVTTTSYTTGGMTQLAPRGALFKDTASVLVQSQSAIQDGYQGTRVDKVTSGGNLTAFNVRHMLDKPRETSGTAGESTSYMGWVVVGEAAPYGNPMDPESWDFNGGGDHSSGSSSGSQQNGSCGGGGTNITDMLYTKSEDVGNDTFGADYSFQAGITNDSGGWAGAKADANMTLFGETLNVIDIGAEMADDGTDGWFTITGWNLLPNYEDPFAFTFNPEKSVTLLEAQAVFWGVTVKGELNGVIGLEATADGGFSSATLNVTPSAAVVAELSASIGGWCLSAGVYGELTIIEASVPSDFTVSWANNSWSASTALTLSSLDGEVYVKINYCVGSAKKTLFSWDGLVDETIWSDSASGCL